MSTYSESNFNTQHYDDSRPNYPESFYQALIDYHSKKSNCDIAVDIGCGSGFVTFKLLQYFKHVIGTDPSSSMINQCISSLSSKEKSEHRIEFLLSTAEQQPDIVKEKSVDLITGAECCHWVDHPKFFKESARVLKPNGTLAYWFYKDPVFIGFPKANEVYNNYTYGSSCDNEEEKHDFERYMGPYYQQPGHEYLRTLLKEIEVPENEYYDIVRHEYISERDGIDSKVTPLFIRKTITMTWFKNYVKSWSAYHNWMQDHGSKYDISDKFVQDLKDVTGWDDDTEIEVIWDTVYTFARKR